MACFNAEKYVKQAIDSIINQTFEDWELIVVDDKSTDNTYHILNQYKDDRITIFQNEKNEGPAYSRTFSLHHAKGEFIAVFDADDISMPKRLEIEYQYLLNHPEIQLVSSDADIIDESNKIIYRRYVKRRSIYSEEMFVKILFHCTIYHSSVMIRGSFLKINHLEYDLDYPCNQDYHLWSRIIFLGKMVKLSESLIKYRISSNQISATKRGLQLKLANRLRSEMFTKLKIKFSERELEVFNMLEIGEFDDMDLILNTLSKLYLNVDSSFVNKDFLKQEILLQISNGLKNKSILGIHRLVIKLSYYIKMSFFDYLFVYRLIIGKKMKKIIFR